MIGEPAVTNVVVEVPVEQFAPTFNAAVVVNEFALSERNVTDNVNNARNMYLPMNLEFTSWLLVCHLSVWTFSMTTQTENLELKLQHWQAARTEKVSNAAPVLEVVS